MKPASTSPCAGTSDPARPRGRRRRSFPPHPAAAAAALAAACQLQPALAADWRRTEIAAAGRVLAAATPVEQAPGEILVVVMEGDGRAFDRKGRPTPDPTPKRPVGFALAQAWPSGPVAWLGRLCQFVRAHDPECSPADWSGARFSETAVSAASSAVDELKRRSGARRVALVGWSGGGVLATLVAMRRDDVAALATLAAPLDLAAWTGAQRLDPLDASLDPAALAFPHPLPQAHLLGRFDPVVPPGEAAAAARRLGGPQALVRIVPERHDCCWTARLDELAAFFAEAALPAGNRTESPSD